MEKSTWYVIFTIDSYKFALTVDSVITVIQSVYIQTIQDLPDSLLGAIDFHGNVIPVVNLRKILGLPVKLIKLTDHFIISKFGEKVVAIPTDKAMNSIHSRDLTDINPKNLYFNSKMLKGIMKLNDDIILLADIDILIKNEELIVFEDLTT